MRMAHTIIPPPRCTAATLELTHKGNINDKTIPERDGEVRDFNVTLLASAITRRRHLVIDTHRTDFGVSERRSLDLDVPSTAVPVFGCSLGLGSSLGSHVRMGGAFWSIVHC